MRTCNLKTTLTALGFLACASLAEARHMTCRPLPEKCALVPMGGLPYPDRESARENGVSFREMPPARCRLSRDAYHDLQVFLDGRYFLCSAD